MTTLKHHALQPNSASRIAGLVRVAFGLSALTFAKSVFPNIHGALGWMAAYTAIAVSFQWLIHHGIMAGEKRSLAMGLVDTAFLSYVVYLLGPASSVLPFVYLLIPVVNAASSSTRSRVAMRLAGVGSLAYIGLLVLTALNVLPHAPARPELLGSMPPIPQLIASGTLVMLSVLITTNIVLRQMTALDRMNARLAELSHLDELTGLFNRRHLMAELRRQLDRLARGGSFSVMMIDLDGFKRINDELGHDAGDLLLIDIARALHEETRAVDLVARYGGDEFVVLLSDATPDGTLAVAQRIVDAVARIASARWARIPVTASVGIALADKSDDLGSLMRRADSQAYAAKRAGGDRFSIASYAVPTRSGVVLQPQASQAQGLDVASKRRNTVTK